MKKIPLTWAIIWSVMSALSVLSVFWNPSHFFTLAISVIFTVLFWHDYKKTKDM